LPIGRSGGAREGFFRGKKVTKELADTLGVDRRALGKAVEKVKGASGLKGADNVDIGRASGDVFDKRTGELLGRDFN